MAERFGESLPHMAGDLPGPASRALGARLSAVESRNITPASPIFWVAASGANVRDADGNIYVDLTAGFSVAAAGHAHGRVAAAIAEQAGRLAHGLGDVHPPDVKVRLLERLAALAPGRLGVSILASSGAEAVEAALKTALLRTGRAGVLAFEGGYHGLTYGALATTWRRDFRQPFSAQLFGGVRFAPFGSLSGAVAVLDEAERSEWPIGAVLVEPVQGRAGIVVPPAGFLAGLRSLCDERGHVLIFDEIYTGFGRTGRWFACEHAGVQPDLMTVGKALTGSLPLSAAIGTPEVMSAWPRSTGEAIHTSTFLGNPISCAAALAQLGEIEGRGLVERSAELGSWLRARLEEWRGRHAAVGAVRGLGLMQGVELVRPDGAPASELAARVLGGALRRGVLMLGEGPGGNVLAFTPPLVISERQLEHALQVVEEELALAEAAA